MTNAPEGDSLEVIARLFERDAFAQSLGIELIEVGPGACRVAMTLTPGMLNFHGMPHGGVIFSLADCAFAVACNSRGRAAVALSMDIHYVSAAPAGSRLVAEAVEESLNGRTGLYRMTVRAETAEGEQLVASLHGMAYRKAEH